jgi:aspartyl-tRNA(Asn)/glutamyl-tRNA(Gln) amidotransferase subunit B
MNVQSSTSKLIKGATGDWEVVIGMEVHAQVNTKAKLFSGAATAFGGAPNSHVSLVDAAMPGMLPVINEECVAQAVRTGLGLNAKINLRSVFDRKNYFYPDLPQGYQISQYKSPVVGEGEVAVDMPYGTVRVGIERLHLEQDAGKSLHDQHPAMSLVDLNRSGVALMEIVSKPDLRSSEEAKAFLAKLRAILRYLGTCDGDMEKGNLRADVNVSVRRPGDPLGTRCEIKNVNSIRFVGQAIDYEARRQIQVLEDGGAIEQETRLFDAGRNQTRSMRNKEEAHDYRYFPDPDLLPLELSEAYVAELGRHLPELPDAKKARFMSTFGLAGYDAGVLVAEKESADFFEAAVTRADGKLGAQRTLRAPQPGRPPDRGFAGLVGPTRRHPGPDRRGHHLRQDRQGTIRDRVGRGRGAARTCRGTRHDPGYRYSRDRKARRRGHRQQSRQGFAGEDEARNDRMVRRSGDEGIRRQGEPAGRERAAQGKARPLTSLRQFRLVKRRGGVKPAALLHESFGADSTDSSSGDPSHRAFRRDSLNFFLRGESSVPDAAFVRGARARLAVKRRRATRHIKICAP